MTERPILFSAPMIRAIQRELEPKNQTRRIVGMRGIGFIGGASEDHNDPALWGAATDDGRWAVLARGLHEQQQHGSCSIACPYGTTGDRLWVRETWRTEERATDHVDGIRFRADDAFAPIENTAAAADQWVEAYENNRHGEKWRPSIFMRRWASRITLDVLSIRIERLQAITDADIIAEGITNETVLELAAKKRSRTTPVFPRLQDVWAFGWDAINGKRAPWASNPWVWVIGFKRVEVAGA